MMRKLPVFMGEVTAPRTRRTELRNTKLQMVRWLGGFQDGDTESPCGESKKRDRAGCSSLNRLPAFVPTWEFLPPIAR
jgi:hypothetical protein